MSATKDSLGQLIVARYGNGNVAAIGVCKMFCEVPSISIETLDGRKINWRADMCEVLPLTKEEVCLLVANNMGRERP